MAADETGLADFPDECPWEAAAIIDHGWMPG